MAREFIEQFENWLAGEGPAPYDVGEQRSSLQDTIQDLNLLIGVPYEEYVPVSSHVAVPSNLQYVPTPREQLQTTTTPSARTQVVRIPNGPEIQVPLRCREFRTEWGGYRWRIRFDRDGKARFMRPKKFVFSLLVTRVFSSNLNFVSVNK